VREEVVLPPGPGEVQVDVHAVGLNRAEALFRRGAYVEQPELPARIGYEATGLVAAVGKGVSGFAIGDAVSLIPLPSLTRWGSWGEVVNLPADYLVRHSADLGWERLAATWMATATAYGALVHNNAQLSSKAVAV
jgi:NADPH:quinone reductase